MNPSSRTLTIIYEDKDIIVCDKPHGIATQSKNMRTPDLERMILNHLAMENRKTGKNGRPYLAVIHRLDQPVAGILVFAKTPAAAKNLSAQLTTKGFGKHYKALVTGTPPKAEGTLADYLMKDSKTNTSRVCDAKTPGAKEARLHYRTLEIKEDGNSLLEVTLDTGRHHQIRVQLSHMGCPIVGDTKYNPEAISQGHYQEIGLCAYKLEFKHPVTGKFMKFEK